jgi:hypothetical protein
VTTGTGPASERRRGLPTAKAWEATKIVQPMILAHFQELRMDTPEDEALRLEMLATVEHWSDLVLRCES